MYSNYAVMLLYPITLLPSIDQVNNWNINSGPEIKNLTMTSKYVNKCHIRTLYEYVIIMLVIYYAILYTHKSHCIL